MQEKKTESINQFLNLYTSLTRFQQKIFRYLQWLSKNFRSVFPCLVKIANVVGCCSRTVQRVLNMFEAYGWLFKKKRGYASNLYFLDADLISIDLDKANLLGKCPDNVHVLVVPSSEHTYNPKKSQDLSIKDRKIPHFLNLKGIKTEDQQRLANKFSDCALIQAVEYAQQYESFIKKQGRKIVSAIAVLMEAAKRYS